MKNEEENDLDKISILLLIFGKEIYYKLDVSLKSRLIRANSFLQCISRELNPDKLPGRKL